MPSRIARPLRCGYRPHLVLLALVGVSYPLGAQELPLQRDYPGAGPYQCPAISTPPELTPEDRARAGQFASEAAQAEILGDLEGARDLFGRAVEVDRANADLAYRYASILADLGEAEESIYEFCHALAFDSASSGLEDARALLDEQYDVIRSRISPAALNAFVQGLDLADSGLFAEAANSFTSAIQDAPEWSAPVFNRAVVLEELGDVQASLDDFRTYLGMVPSAPDVVFVSERIGQLEGAALLATPNPAGALVLGTVPGMGHFYSGRPRAGALILGTVAAAVFTGSFVRNITVVCLNPVPDGQPCPPAEIVDEITERPLMVPALGIAAAVTFVGAIEALLNARSRRAQADAITEGAGTGGFGLQGPSLSARGSRLELSMLRVRFR